MPLLRDPSWRYAFHWGMMMLGVYILALVGIVAGVGVAHGQTIPVACVQYQRAITAAAHNEFGLRAPVSTLAGQVAQESACNASAQSRVGAQGLTQFMPATAKWLAELYPRELGPADPLNPSWAINAQARYMRHLMRAKLRAALPACAAWWFALRDYNGGSGWTERERRLTFAAGLDWHNPAHVEKFNAGRSAANHRENTEYPRRILFRHAPRFVRAGFGPNVDCSEYENAAAR